MLKISMLLFVVVFFACGYERYQRVDRSWKERGARPDRILQPHLREVQDEKSSLHGKEVELRGKLVYEYDDVAIYPITDSVYIKPVWIHLDQEDLDLHQFLLANDQTLVNIVGILDTSNVYDEGQYSSAIKDILSVDVTHVLAKQ